MEARRFRRIPFATEVRLTSGQQDVTCHLIDVALKGALLEVDEPQAFPLGLKACLTMALPDSEIILEFDAELVHREKNRLGFKFLHENLATLTHLRTLLELNSGDADGIRDELLAWLKG